MNRVRGLQYFIDWIIQSMLLTIKTFQTKPLLATSLLILHFVGVYVVFFLSCRMSQEKVDRFYFNVIIIFTLIIGSVGVGAFVMLGQHMGFNL